mmetsp:Transcript_7230/g.20232  ORF Transcript_7230/g.20232 Transcript_7230/m.20232 type:complete len:217 (-) Transcript_7230:771-1421(-)
MQANLTGCTRARYAPSQRQRASPGVLDGSTRPSVRRTRWSSGTLDAKSSWRYSTGSTVPRPRRRASAWQRPTFASTFGPRPRITWYPGSPSAPGALKRTISHLSSPSRSRTQRESSSAASTSRFWDVAASATAASYSFRILPSRVWTVAPWACGVLRQRKAQPRSFFMRQHAMTALCLPVSLNAQISCVPSMESPARPSSRSEIPASAMSSNGWPE